MALRPYRDLLLFTIFISVWWGTSSSLAFVILTPANETTLIAGQTTEVVVAPGPNIGVAQVRYYWYRLDEEPKATQLAVPALVTTGAAHPPYGGRLMVPLDAIGRLRLLAVGDAAEGRIAGHEEFDEVMVTVKVEADLQRIEFEVQKPWRLDTLGRILDIPVVGQFADGVSRRIGGKFGGSSYKSSNDAVVSVTGEGQVRVVGNGRATITVSNAGKQGAVEVVVRASGDDTNSPPTARTDSELTVRGGSKVMLNGLASSDPDGDPIRYEWMQVAGNKVSLLDPNTAQATFMAPRVSSRRLFRFALRVTDMKGPDTVKGADSLAAYVDVWVIP